MRRRVRSPAWCAALLCVGSLWADAVQARAPRSSRAPHAASTPSAPTTAQILAPSQRTVPDALPPDRQVYRCGNSYSARTCVDGKQVDVADARSDAQRRQSLDLTARDQRLAAWLEGGRRARDAAASAPSKTRAAVRNADCVETAAITCQPKKPRPRHAVSKAASGAARR